jgi:Fe-S-cluster containining protein
MKNDEFVNLGVNDAFEFSCGPNVACFNECCRDLNQFLTPYDIIRLKNHLSLPCMEFLELYTSQHTGPETGLPIVRLKQDPSNESICPFVTPRGCGVYQNRPSSCRAYPIARAVYRNRNTGALTEHYMLFKEAHCQGFATGARQTVGEWIESQGLSPYNEMNDLLMDIISLKNQLIPGPLDFKSGRLFHQACYNLDSFREKIFSRGNFEDAEFDENLLAESETDDAALLRVSLQWLKKKLFQK